MGRRNSFSNVPRGYTSDERASLGDVHVNDAIMAINKMQQRAVAAMTHYPLTRGQTLAMLFLDDDIAKLTAVRGLVKTDSNVKAYPIGNHKGMGVKEGAIILNIDFETAQVPAIEPGIMVINPARISPLVAFTAAVTAEHDKYEELKGVLRWLNRACTPAAIRYFFPQAMTLVPTSPIWRDLQDVPSRYTMPADYGVWAQALRDAANTVAGMLLLPGDVNARKRDTMWLTFKETSVHLDASDPHKIHYKTDQVLYNI